ncbi:MAG: Eco57I restriction-modification methylase domain-containing protein, partial [Nitrospirota bacterium]
MNNMNLSIFQSKNLFEAGTEFFSQIGIALNSNTSVSLDAKEILRDRFKDTDIFNNIRKTYFLGLVDDSAFDKNISLLDKDKITYEEAASKIDLEYNGIMVFGVKLSDNYLPKRGEIAELTRAFNRMSKNIPVVLLLQYGSQLSLAASERTRYQQKWREGEKIGKISLLKDINLTSPHAGHLKILYDLKLKPGIVTFNVMYKQWREVFNVQLLNKRFYTELANWYFWAVKQVKFPDNCEKDDEDVRNAASVIRLITRLIFIWFVKEKGLIPDDLFNQDRLKRDIKFTDRNNSTYYKAILQNLFFATLNTEMNKDKPGIRKFRHKAKKTGGRDQHYMIHNIFRYEDYFINPQDTLERYFENIPFLNGGLFECLDREVVIEDIKQTIRIDGFSDRKDNVLTVPDKLFFSPEQTIDLNETYGTKNKRYKVRGLIEILNSYKFTITENTPVEEEIALDPELLGKVFENLLASYNPETKTTARKQTGSYYTPREIVHYMVDESLIAYLNNHLNSTEDSEDKLRDLFDYSEEPHQFSDAEVDILIDAIDSVKILDPACGSGAFPMGILHKLVYILGKLDPDNQKWRQKQINKVLEIPDSTVREKLLEDIEQSFQSNELDYGRKLYLIENSIYGVDIQPIAVQIAKLRFFISLIVDQKVNTKEVNLGIRPLPNLETKFAAANTLIGIEKPEQITLSNPAIDEKEKELKEIRKRHLTARTQQTKKKYRKEDERLRAEIAEMLKKDGMPHETTEKLAHWNPYDQNASADFFDPEWMFGVRDGFDVVIGNPPYGNIINSKLKMLVKREYNFSNLSDISSP